MSCNWGALGLSWSHVHSPKFDAGWKKKNLWTRKPWGNQLEMDRLVAPTVISCYENGGFFRQKPTKTYKN